MSRIGGVKQGFFNKLPHTKTQTRSFKDDFNLNQLKSEFSSLYSLFIANQSLLKNNREIILYLDYLCQVLIDYYTVDYVANELENAVDKKNKITRFMKQESLLEATMAVEGKANSERVVSPWVNLRMAAIHVGKTAKSSARLRASIARLIAARSYWNNSRALANHLIRFAVHCGLAEEFGKLNQALGVQFGVSEFLLLLDKSQGALRISSVALNGLRLLVNVSTLVKHLILAASHKKLSVRKVLQQEIEKRIYSLTDDLMWGTVNLLSNYRQLFNLSASAVAGLNLVFLGMDAVMLMVSWRIDRKNYFHNTQELMRRKEGGLTALQAAIINRQLDILADEWQAQCAYYLFNIGVAVMLFAVFVTTLIVANPLLLAFLAIFSMTGNAMYNSAKEFKQYRQAVTEVRREELNRQFDKKGSQVDRLRVKEDEAFSCFFNTLLFNIGFTASLIAAAAVSLPLAAMLVVFCLGYKIQQSFEEKDSGLDWMAEDSESIYRIPAEESLPSRSLCG